MEIKQGFFFFFFWKLRKCCFFQVCIIISVQCVHSLFSASAFKMKLGSWSQREAPLPADWLLLSGGCFESLSFYFYALWQQKATGMWRLAPIFFVSSWGSQCSKIQLNSLQKKTPKKHLSRLNYTFSAVICSLKHPPFCSTRLSEIVNHKLPTSPWIVQKLHIVIFFFFKE